MQSCVTCFLGAYPHLRGRISGARWKRSSAYIWNRQRIVARISPRRYRSTLYNKLRGYGRSQKRIR